MKRIIITGVVSAIAAVSFAGTASAAPADPVRGTPQCFGQIHKLINSGDGSVGDLVKEAGGQGKNAAAKGLCALPK